MNNTFKDRASLEGGEMRYSLEDIKKLLATPQWNYSFKPHDWFFPNDLVPHSSSLKYSCRKLAEQGLLEQRKGGRWGYSYKVKEVQHDLRVAILQTCELPTGEKCPYDECKGCDCPLGVYNSFNPKFMGYEPSPEMPLISEEVFSEAWNLASDDGGSLSEAIDAVIKEQQASDMAWHENEVRQLKNEITDLRGYINFSLKPSQEVLKDALYAVSIELRDTGLLSDEAIMEILKQAHLRAMAEGVER